MRNRLFGWDYPPGVSKLPWDEEYPCEVCGQSVDECICPECLVCEEWGNPQCYIHHGLHRTEEQKFLKEVAERQWEAWNKAENEYWEKIEEEITKEKDTCDTWP